MLGLKLDMEMYKLSGVLFTFSDFRFGIFRIGFYYMHTYCIYFLGLLNSAEHLLENQEHLSAIRALATVRLDTWKTFAQTAGAKSFSDWMSFSLKLCGIYSLSLSLSASPPLRS